MKFTKACEGNGCLVSFGKEKNNSKLRKENALKFETKIVFLCFSELRMNAHSRKEIKTTIVKRLLCKT